MITTPTVLIFGAGISHPFGFPLGIGLRNNIIENLEPSNGFYRELCEIGFSDGQVNTFRKGFRDSGKESVDAFLEHATEFLDVGKAAIAQELMRYESQSILFKTQGDNFYYYLYKQINAKPGEFPNNKLSIITYNYDRSFEHFLFRALKNSYRLSNADATQLMESVPIIHLHGSLGLLPWQRDGGLKYGGTDNRRSDVQLASKSIRIIHEEVDLDKDPEFRRAYTEIDKAKRIVLLGFGYDDKNLERLRLPVSKGKGQCRFFGSCYKLTQNERTNLNAKFFNNNAIFGDSRLDALNFLREAVSLS